MSDTRALYEKVVLDHAKKPRHFGSPEKYDYKCEGLNPLCGDHYTVYLKMNGDRIEHVWFDGQGCAISKASASMMTEAIEGKTVQEAKQLFTKFHQMVTAPPDAPVNTEDIGKLRALEGVREFPMRIKCATLAWHSMTSALEENHAAVSTE
jgi:nitrogen fixation protein NifU and related proteins